MSHKLFFRFLVLLTSTAACVSPLSAQTKPARKAPPKVYTIQGDSARPSPPKKEGAGESYGLTFENWKLTISVNKDGTSTETTDLTERFDTIASLNSFGKYRLEFNSDLSDVAVSDAYYVKPDGTKKPFSDKAFRVRLTPQAEAAPSFSSLKMLEVDLTETEPGDLVHYVTTKTDKRNYFDGKFDTFAYLTPVANWRSAEIELSAPSDYPLQIEAIYLDGGKTSDTSDGRAHWRWSVKNRSAVSPGELLLDHIGIAPKLAVSAFRDYDELGRAYWAEAEKKAVLTPDLQKLADEITKDAKTPEQQAYDIYTWVNKNIRYLSIVLDRGGWIPHSSTEIVANRYGDCKDYSTILNSLLRAKNIESYPVLIRSDFTSWFPSVAIPSYFNHEILYIPSLDLFADATNPNTRLGMIPQTVVGKKAFLAGTKVGVVQTPGDRPNDNQIVSSTDVSVLPNGGLKAVSRNSYIGRSEILFRPIFAGPEIRASSDAFVPVLLSFFGLRGSGRILKIGDPFKVNEPFEVELEISLDNYTDLRPNGSFSVPVALNMSNPLALEALVTAEDRVSDLNVGATHVREEYSISFPDGVDPQAGTRFEFSNAVGTYTKTFRLEGEKVIFVRDFVIKKDVVSAAEYPQLRELIRKLVDNYTANIKYVSSRPVVPNKTAANDRTVATNSFSPYDVSAYLPFKRVTAQQAAALEAQLLKDPDNLTAHRDLLVYYTDTKIKLTPARIKSQIRHYTWFIEHRPELYELRMMAPVYLDRKIADQEFKAIWPVWMSTVTKNRTNAVIRLNAYEYVKHFDPVEVENLLLEGMKADPSNYEYPLKLSEFFSTRFDTTKPEPDAVRLARVEKQFKYGQTAVDLLKTERSPDRDYKRMGLLQNLSRAALEAAKYDAAKKLATELILEFGQDDTSSYYDSASHIGNIVLGRLALKQNDVQKAAEYLLISIRAPLRKSNSWLPEIDTELAKELLKAGQKDAVLEYLRLCEGLSNLKREKDLFADTVRALQKWQEQIKAGQTPSWDFYRP